MKKGQRKPIGVSGGGYVEAHPGADFSNLERLIALMDIRPLENAERKNFESEEEFLKAIDTAIKGN